MSGALPKAGASGVAGEQPLLGQLHRAGHDAAEGHRVEAKLVAEAFMWKMASRSRMQQLIHRAIVSNSGRTPSPA